MRGLREVLDAIEILDGGVTDMLVGLALALVIPANGDHKWYVYATLENPNPLGKSWVLHVLNMKGTQKNSSLSRLRLNPHLRFILLGTFDKIRSGLEYQAQLVDKELSREMETVVAHFKREERD